MLEAKGRSMLLLAIAPGNCLVQEIPCLRRDINEGHRKNLILVSPHQTFSDSCATLRHKFASSESKLLSLSESLITQHITPRSDYLYSQIMDPFFTRDYREARFPLDVNALKILQIVDLCSTGLVDCSTPRQGALGADYRALYGLEETRGNHIQQSLRAFELTLFLPELAHFLPLSVVCMAHNSHMNQTSLV